MNLVKNKLRVSHYPQIPCAPFRVDVKDEFEAYKIMETLADQHCFLFDNNFIPDYANMITVEMWDDDLDEDENGSKWTDYYNNDEQVDWDQFKEEFIIQD